nr:MAG TPA: hypothetical protein [Caudoviricetes sp.]DAX38642.1 MAG TPA: hypothetical protein [Caudoviricetes sp.]
MSKRKRAIKSSFLIMIDYLYFLYLSSYLLEELHTLHQADYLL